MQVVFKKKKIKYVYNNNMWTKIIILGRCVALVKTRFFNMEIFQHGGDGF
jgi:hypothetical protein